MNNVTLEQKIKNIVVADVSFVQILRFIQSLEMKNLNAEQIYVVEKYLPVYLSALAQCMDNMYINHGAEVLPVSEEYANILDSESDDEIDQKASRLIANIVASVKE